MDVGGWVWLKLQWGWCAGLCIPFENFVGSMARIELGMGWSRIEGEN